MCPSFACVRRARCRGPVETIFTLTFEKKVSLSRYTTTAGTLHTSGPTTDSSSAAPPPAPAAPDAEDPEPHGDDMKSPTPEDSGVVVPSSNVPICVEEVIGPGDNLIGDVAGAPGTESEVEGAAHPPDVGAVADALGTPVDGDDTPPRSPAATGDHIGNDPDDAVVRDELGGVVAPAYDVGDAVAVVSYGDENAAQGGGPGDEDGPMEGPPEATSGTQKAGMDAEEGPDPAGGAPTDGEEAAPDGVDEGNAVPSWPTEADIDEADMRGYHTGGVYPGESYDVVGYAESAAAEGVGPGGDAEGGPESPAREGSVSGVKSVSQSAGDNSEEDVKWGEDGAVEIDGS